MSKNTWTKHKEFGDNLHAARQSIYRNELKNSSCKGFVAASIVIAAVCVIILAASLVCFIAGIDFAFSGWSLFIAAFTVGAIAFCWVFLPALRRYPGQKQAAEHLDLACSSHNQIATALDLYTSKRFTLFGRCAIEQGLSVLKKNNTEKPWLVEYSFPAGSVSVKFIAALVMLSAAVWINGLSRTGPGQGGRETAPLSGDSVWAGETDDTEKSQQGENPRQRKVENWKQSMAGSPQAASSGADQRKTDELQGLTSKSTSLSETAVESQGSGSSAAGASLSSKNAPPRKPAKKSASKKDSDEAVPEERKLPESSKASSMSSGSAGKGSTPAVYNTWSQNESTGGEGPSPEEEDEEVEDKEESNRNRGGIQPHLKDRTQAPNRELNIGGAKGDKPGTGRGGPGPTKKSRGTASLVLGVPVPDFVKGKMGPGVNKVIQERGRPQIEAGEHAESIDVVAGEMPDTPANNSGVSSDFRELVRDYMLRLNRNGN
ncbi:hypothetical protein SMSP2_01442 [Limihaloglobus sulfuriphilus]|uniref:Uncharacterized protein n=1 Tax=Limihaloglobus sulfuriphilus TaxID=1851148 RepID=A0A1Q2MEV9_9BACT|nr:hypothetical protein [Limihaloglobus sulfuriphilus]AQQ71078.1 hypothetical protein SMSP2_01442 [Limihaloglobus sulfuriphilus]